MDIVRFSLTLNSIMTIRTVFFWLHLSAGVIAGVVVLIMSITGVALTYEKQVLEWADRGAWSVPSSARSERLSPETLLARVRAARPEAAPAVLTLRQDPAAPATVAFEGAGAVLVDPTSGHVIGAPPGGLRAFFRVMTSWHRWLALEGTSRAVGKAVTGAANLVFLFIVLSGMYLWLPKIWSLHAAQAGAAGSAAACQARPGISTGTTSSASGRRFRWPSSWPARCRSPIPGRATSFTESLVRSRPARKLARVARPVKPAGRGGPSARAGSCA